MRVVLYTREGCCLCDDAKAMLEKHLPGTPIGEIDIDGDPVLHERFTDCVPVVEINGRIRFRGRVNEMLLRRLIRNEPTDA